MSPSNGSSTADLVRRLSEDTSRLVRQEIELAKAELTEKGKKAGVGGGGGREKEKGGGGG